MGNLSKCLVTGCAGFIGSRLSERLIEGGCRVVGIDCFTSNYSPSLKRFNIANLMKSGSFEMIELDLSEASIKELLSILKDVDYVVHEAAQASVRGSWGHGFKTYVRHNIIATQTLFEAVARANNIKRFVFASSSSVYGNIESGQLKEDMPLKPFSPYGVTKLAGETLCRTYCENFNVPIVILRYFTVYGPRQRPDMAFHEFMKAILKDEPVGVYGDGSQMRDFTYVDDVVEATIRALEEDDAVGEVINVGSDKPVKLIDAIKAIAEILEVEPKIVQMEKQKGDVKYTCADISKAMRLLNWKPMTNLREGLANQAAWMKQAIKLNFV